MKKIQLTIAFVFITLGIVLIASSLTHAQRQGEFTVPLSDPAKRGKLKAHLNSGSITVKGSARKDVLVTYDSKDEDKDDESTKDGLKRISGGSMQLSVTEDNNYVSVKSDSWTSEVDIQIEVPSGTDLVLHTYNNGDILVTNVQGAVEITNYNGEIEAQNISGSVVATTYNGEIKVTFDKVTENAPMSFSTYNGDIDITFPASVKASFKMRTERGEVYTGFEMAMSKEGPVQKKEQDGGAFKVVVDQWVKGSVNGGGPEFTMKNYNGDIYIRKK